jgi:signal transduction histidine kinase
MPRVVGEWDKLRIDQVVTNLLSNAVKYGLGRPIKATVSGDIREAVISVQDFGIGISKEDQENIFERFGRAVSVRRFGGLGLGLYITRQIVEAHDGRISLESVINQGSTFTVRLPLKS